ncbi:uncharacterized protein LOC125502217 [Athalia rosae]|uniref:uncharacterized protein LOC125502217 n=1 Tax=Athalia rosae TaxID=37344 RepID=UPI00203370D2|nr:uncharacterized protein LOC125502217 [Athalia rosae]
MKPIYSSILCPFFFAVLCEAYPATAPYFDYHRPSFAKDSTGRGIHEMVKIDDSRAHDEQQESDLLEDLRRLSNPAGDEEADNLLEDPDDYTNWDKRATSNGKYHYYRCYFNPVTCYRK